MIDFLKKNELNQEIKSLSKKTKYISIIRLILSINIIVWLACLLSLNEYLLYGSLTLFFLILNIVFIILTNKYFVKLSILKKKIDVYTSHERRRRLELNYFNDKGSEFLAKDDYKLSDLDIFGSNSLYQYLVSAKTLMGRSLLAKQLSDPEKLTEGFTDSILELSTEDSFSLEASLLEFTDDLKRLSTAELINNTKDEIKLTIKSFIPLISFILMIINIVLVFINPAIFSPYVLLIYPFVSFISIRICLKNDVFSLNTSKYSRLLDAYLFVVGELEKNSYETRYLKNLKEGILKYKTDLVKLNKLFHTLSSRNNIVANILLNGLAVYDFFIIIRYNQMIKKINSIEGLFKDISYLELLLSFRNIAIDNDIYSIPKQGSLISGTRLYHPLVKGCVDNDFTLNGGVILTGSNMSGKTTFMRTLGINQVLFNAGSIVCAACFTSLRLPIFTSLRANDMLSEGISTFYAEILRMKLMNEASIKGGCLILVDEIFKGTNAYERIKGSEIIINKFIERNAFFIISTHDFELCDVKGILNYHFNEDYNDDKISFDYKIKEGKCQSSNALYLLKMANII